MTPAEKWERLSNPETVEDYGLGMTLTEIAQVPEAAAEVVKYLPVLPATGSFEGPI